MSFRKRTVGSLFAFALSLLLVVGVLAQDTEPPHWEYEGEPGPEHWGELSEQFALCSSGTEQSPVDILTDRSADLSDIQVNYLPSALTIKNNGHTVQVDYEAGSSITVDGTEYNLVQFHFHHHSEHTIEGVIYPLELHLVHADADGHLAVVGVLIKEGLADNAAFASVFDNFPDEEVEPHLVEGATVDAAGLLPADRMYYAYNGSLTTPPCSEGVHWMVLTTPISLSREQINTFADVFPLDARPVQVLGEREITADNAANS